MRSRAQGGLSPKEQRVKRTSRSIGWLVTVLAVVVSVRAWAAPRDKDPGGGPTVVVPDPLKPWIPWVLYGDGEAARCPQLAGHEDERVCAWPARLTLALGDSGGTFTQAWQIWGKGSAELPGDEEHWPQEVRVDGKPAAVIGDETPSLLLAPGHHVVSGKFAWETLPDALAAPTETGLLSLTIRGRRIDFPLRDEDGRVFLGRKEAPAETDSADISVYRKLTDDNPLMLATRLQLAVSGKSRQLLLGRALPVGFEAQAVESPLPLRLDPDGRLRLQVRPGSWTITLTARRVTAGDGVTRPQPGGLWKEGEEVWVFEARPDLRLTDVQGPQAIDPAQTTLPGDWKALPAYAMPPGATLTLVERRRGDGDTARDQLQLQRSLWLDFDGGGYTVSDRISGRFAASWRLEAAPRTELGRVSIDGHDQFITRVGPDGHDGVEIRSGRADVSADSRIEGSPFTLPATGFAHDFDSLQATLAIPPGWRLIHATGADKVTGTWIDRWSLLDFFLMLVTALAVQRLFGWQLGLLALVGVGLTITERGAPAAIWLAVLLGEAVVRALGGGKLQAAARIYRVAAWTLLVGLLFPYAVSEIRRGVHPASAHEQLSDRFEQLLTGGFDAKAPEEQDAPAAPASATAEGALGHDSAAGLLGNLVGKQIGQGYGVGGLRATGAASNNATPKPEGLRGIARRAAPKNENDDNDQERMRVALSQNRYVYDPSVVVQTGPGLPSWGWETAGLIFNGPVRQDQELHLYLAPPWLNLLLSLGRVALLAMLALSILRRPLRLGGGWHGARPLFGAAAALVVLLGFGAPAQAAETALPSPELLSELKSRLLRAPACAPDCGAIGRMALEATPGELRLVLEAAAAAPVAIPLPGGGKDWSPTVARIDGKLATSLSRGNDGILWLALPAGTFRVELTGPLPARDSVQIALPMQPRFVTAKTRGWTVDGLHEDGAVDESLKLSRQSKPGAGEISGENDAAPTLPPFLRVERTLHLGLRWEVDTVVRRETPEGTPVVIEVPLLPGEAITTPGVRIDKGRSAASVSLGPDASELAWHSTLAESPSLRLRADPASATRWAETWRLDLGPTWHAELGGIAAVHRADADAARVPEWRPWPGEEVRIALSKPAGAGGQTLTVDGASLVLAPSVRSTRATLTLDIRSSRGAEHAITLAEGVDLTSVTLDGASLPLRLESDGRHLVLPIAPGKHSFVINWHEPAALSAMFRAPAIDLGVRATNVEVQIDLSEAPRWVLWAAGPRLGPAVQLWSVVLILLLLAAALGRTGLTPLGWWDWTLLGLGLSQLPLPAAGVVAAFLLGLGWRARHPIAGRPLLYDLTQLIIAALAVASVSILFSGIEAGLVSQPDMRVMGNGSTSALLRWYQDRAGQILPRPAVFSAPLMVYRGVMLLWSLWLAVASLAWARWVWRCLRAEGWWQPVRAKREPPLPVLPTGEPQPEG
jgi:hypothetical protein